MSDLDDLARANRELSTGYPHQVVRRVDGPQAQQPIVVITAPPSHEPAQRAGDSFSRGFFITMGVIAAIVVLLVGIGIAVAIASEASRGSDAKQRAAAAAAATAAADRQRLARAEWERMDAERRMAERRAAERRAAIPRNIYEDSTKKVERRPINADAPSLSAPIVVKRWTVETAVEYLVSWEGESVLCVQLQNRSPRTIARVKLGILPNDNKTDSESIEFLSVAPKQIVTKRIDLAKHKPNRAKTPIMCVEEGSFADGP